MKKLKLMTIIGTRPDIIKLSEIIKKADRYFEHVLVHTGQNYDYSLNKIFFEDLNLREPDFYLDSVGEDLGETMGNIIEKSYKLLKEIKPDAVLILGDTNSSLSAISAKRLKIPVFHLEAGNRSFDENLPEEINRRIVDHISDVNLPYTEHARRYLLSEGVKKEYIFNVGSPMAEVINHNMVKISSSTILSQLNLEKNKYILLSAHREENIDNENNFSELTEAINKMAETYNMPIIYSIHPRSKKVMEKRKIEFHANVRAFEPFSFTDYVNLEKNAFCVVSDSGTLAEESSYFKFPAVSIRTSTERPEAIDKGNMVLGSITAQSVIESIELVTKMNTEGYGGSDVADYTELNVSTKVIKIIQSYTEIVNRVIWRK